MSGIIDNTPENTTVQGLENMPLVRFFIENRGYFCLKNFTSKIVIRPGNNGKHIEVPNKRSKIKRGKDGSLNLLISTERKKDGTPKRKSFGKGTTVTIYPNEA